MKKERSLQVLNLFRDRVSAYHQSLIGKSQLILIEGTSRRSKNQLFGRNDSNTKVIIDRVSLPDIRDQSKSALSDSDDFEAVTRREIRPGDYVLVRITNGTSQTLFGDPQVICTLEQHTNSIQQRDLHRKQVQQ